MVRRAGLILLVGVLALVFAPGATRPGADRVNPRALSAAVLSPTVDDRGAVATPSRRDDERAPQRALGLLTVLVVLAITSGWRRIAPRPARPLLLPAGIRPPHRGPPVFSV
jgi:hypothetical protein